MQNFEIHTVYGENKSLNSPSNTCYEGVFQFRSQEEADEFCDGLIEGPVVDAYADPVEEE